MIFDKFVSLAAEQGGEDAESGKETRICVPIFSISSCKRWKKGKMLQVNGEMYRIAIKWERAWKFGRRSLRMETDMFFLLSFASSL